MEEVHYHESKFIDSSGCLRITKVPVVQELVRHGLDRLPDRFIQPRPSGSPPSSRHRRLPIPFVDVARLREGSDLGVRAEEQARLRAAAEELGVFVITGHGIGDDVLGGVRDVVKGFFGLSFDEKKGCVGCYMSVDNMGYGRNFVKSDDQPLDWIDRVTVKAFPKSATEGVDVWPQKPSNFKGAMEAYTEQSRDVLDEILGALAEAFSLEKRAFLDYFDRDSSDVNLRINCYMPCPSPDLALGIVPHTDASALTLLIQFGASDGLQILNDGEWHTAEWPEDVLLVSAGDLMEIMSDGRVRSPWHRVATRSIAERFSVAMFYNPPSTATIWPVKGGSGEFREVVVGEYCRHLYEISPTKGKDAINFAKIL
ncbi:hypothetical protein MLD38_013751 [Melastoma candidum]|uniref:Uncharacterized protein n=1 Tax=Melastoma candidum TaxID=119954 RepID=A0ACB9RAM9_9MYRT|nr:hypothetical protein MLD38_013751 [Melastoma candidum]